MHFTREWETRIEIGDQDTDPDAGPSRSAPVVGTVVHGVANTLPDASVVFIALEYGTRDINQVLSALRADIWHYHKGNLDSDLGRAIKAEVSVAFYPDADDWKTMVWDCACEVTEVNCKGLSDA